MPNGPRQSSVQPTNCATRHKYKSSPNRCSTPATGWPTLWVANASPYTRPVATSFPLRRPSHWLLPAWRPADLILVTPDQLCDQRAVHLAEKAIDAARDLPARPVLAMTLPRAAETAVLAG